MHGRSRPHNVQAGAMLASRRGNQQSYGGRQRFSVAVQGRVGQQRLVGANRRTLGAWACEQGTQRTTDHGEPATTQQIGRVAAKFEEEQIAQIEPCLPSASRRSLEVPSARNHFQANLCGRGLIASWQLQGSTREHTAEAKRG